MGAAFPLLYRVTDSKEMADIIANTGFADASVSALGAFAAYSSLRYQLTNDTGPIVSPQVWGNGWARRQGPVPDEWQDMKKDTFNTGRTTETLGWPPMMSAVYDARYDDRSPLQGSKKTPPAPLAADQHYETVNLRPFMNEDPFGDMRVGKGLPWPKPGEQAAFLDLNLGKAGGKLVICGSGEPGFKADQNIVHKVRPGETWLTNWTIYPCYMFEAPVTRSFSPYPPLFRWGSCLFEIVDPRTNDGKGLIALKGGESVTIPVGKKARKLFFLGHVWAFRYEKDPGDDAIIPLLAKTEVGRYEIRFADGTVEQVPVVNRVNASACIFGYPNDEAPFALGSYGGSGWPRSGGVCAFELDCGNREVASISVSGSDPNRALFLWAVTAVVDGPPPEKLLKTVLFGSRNKPGPAVDVVTDAAAEEGKSGWVKAAGAVDGGGSVSLPGDGAVRVLRVTLPEDGWYLCELAVRGDNSVSMLNLTANGRLALWSCPVYPATRTPFWAEAENGQIEFRFVTRPFSINRTGPGKLLISAMHLWKLPASPAALPEPMDLDKALRYGWDPAAEFNEQRGGALYDHVLRFDLPQGDYRFSLKIKHSPISSPNVKCDVWAQDKMVLDDLPVNMREMKSFDVSAPDGQVRLRIALDPRSSLGRIQQWAVDRMEIERVR